MHARYRFGELNVVDRDTVIGPEFGVVLRQLQTGDRSHPAVVEEHNHAAHAMFDRIDRELRTQYRLGYYPSPRPPAGTYRTLDVRVNCECKIRSRKAYYSGGRLD